ncbi:MAG: hydratase [Treponema sp.]|jgi:aconitate hydratase|nr:hydratase [Treponema sp.]
MITLHAEPVRLAATHNTPQPLAKADGVKPGDGTMTRAILDAHNAPGTAPNAYRIRFDSLISHDITYVGVVQTARASGLTRFPVPYALTNCHNSLCAVGGTINEDDHVFGLSAAKKYGGIYVPANQAVLHQYARECLCGVGAMILGSDSHTRFGPLGTMGVGEGGPEVVKQLLANTYDLSAPDVVLVYLTGAPKQGVGPHDVAIALCGAVYDNGFAKNKALEFVGPGIAALSMDFRIGIDVMTTETACLSSIWETDDAVRAYYGDHGREKSYRALHPASDAAYHAMISLDLSTIEPMIALPFHPSKAYTIAEANANAADLLAAVEKDAAEQWKGKAALHLTDKIDGKRIRVDQGIIAGCAGGMYDNIREAAAILDGASIGADYFSLSIYPPSMPVNLQLMDAGIQQRLIDAGAVFKPCFCGPCFGAGDVPANNGLSIRHTTRNFPNREGSRPSDGQLAAVALMDARSVAATARAGGLLTAATEVDYAPDSRPAPPFNTGVYEKRVYNGFGKADSSVDLRFGPNIADWPVIDPLGEHLLLQIASVIRDPVTTTDELIPSGETSSYRSNPLKLAGFTLSRRDPEYVGRAKVTSVLEDARQAGNAPSEAQKALSHIFPNEKDAAEKARAAQIASLVFAMKPGDGSAREQAASCQRVLGGGANLCYEYATKRYRSNLINWGMLPFTLDVGTAFEGAPGDWLYVPNAHAGIRDGATAFPAKLIRGGGGVTDLTLHVGALTADERDIIMAGCLMNYYAKKLRV